MAVNAGHPLGHHVCSAAEAAARWCSAWAKTRAWSAEPRPCGRSECWGTQCMPWIAARDPPRCVTARRRWLVVGARCASTWSAACVPRLWVSGSVKPHQDKIGVHTMPLIHFAQHRRTLQHTRLSMPTSGSRAKAPPLISETFGNAVRHDTVGDRSSKGPHHHIVTSHGSFSIIRTHHPWLGAGEASCNVSSYQGARAHLPATPW